MAYRLYLESGPQRKKTMVHVVDLLGCIANGPTTEAALEATPGEIDSFRRFLAASGEAVDVDAPIEVEVAEHLMQAGAWFGNGSPYATFAPDLLAVTETEVELFAVRFTALSEALAAWGEAQSASTLDAKPPEGRTARAILLHVVGPVGGSLSAALGGATGFSRIFGQAERGEIPPWEAIRVTCDRAVERVRATTPEERAAVVQRPKEVRTLRKGLRHLLEHHWEHLAELGRRPGGPRW